MWSVVMYIILWFLILTILLHSKIVILLVIPLFTNLMTSFISNFNRTESPFLIPYDVIPVHEFHFSPSLCIIDFHLDFWYWSTFTEVRILRRLFKYYFYQSNILWVYLEHMVTIYLTWHCFCFISNSDGMLKLHLLKYCT